MIKQNLNVHYMTSDEYIYNNFYNNKEIISRISQFMPIIKEKKINGDFLEKYLEIILKLKVVVGVDSFYSIDNIFYNIEYITYIFLGHGVSYFKEYLYNDYLGYKKFDKIVIPPFPLGISIAKKYGWKDKNIINLCLPRWDNYNIQKHKLLNKNKYIFLMFTWRKIKNGKFISKLYLNNTFNLLNNLKLNKKLIEKNITIYFSYHHAFQGKKIFNFKNNTNIKIINQTQISKCLRKSSLFITDFSSVVFDFIYQKKPFIIYVPDANDPMIKNNYIKPYYDIIFGLKNNSIYFENKFFNLKKVIDKILYYINNDFKIDIKLKKFFKLFNFKFKDKSHTNSLINYLKKLN